MTTNSSVRSAAKIVFLAFAAPLVARASSTKSVFGVLFYSDSVPKISKKTFSYPASLQDERGWWRSFQHHPSEGVWHDKQVTVRRFSQSMCSVSHSSHHVGLTSLAFPIEVVLLFFIGTTRSATDLFVCWISVSTDKLRCY
jgi:hypothetical protein